jgi:hypothetical protein
MITNNKRVSSKTVFTATHKKAKYIGSHPHLVNTDGVYYYNLDHQCVLYRPNSDDNLSKTDWYRIPNSKTSLKKLE